MPQELLIWLSGLLIGYGIGYTVAQSIAYKSLYKFFWNNPNFLAEMEKEEKQKWS